MTKRRMINGLAATTISATMLAAGYLSLTSDPNPSIQAMFESGTAVYLHRAIETGGDSTIHESCYELPLSSEQVVRELRRQLPGTIDRKGVDGRQLVLPLVDGGRVQVAHYPAYSFLIREGRLNSNSNGDDSEWSHIIVREYKGQSVIESVWRWISERFRA